jgi:hypothetical protein
MKNKNQYRNDRRAKGLCPTCGKVPVKSGHCAECRGKANARKRAERERRGRVHMLDINSIRTDGGTQLRAAIDAEHVESMAAAISRGEKLPPVKVYFDSTDYWLARGFHRRMAAMKAGETRIGAIIAEGTIRDAILDAAGDNSEHNALRRTNADKRKAVAALLADKEWADAADRWIADVCKVDHKTVAAVRAETTSHLLGNSPSEPEATNGQNGKRGSETRKIKTRDGKTRVHKSAVEQASGRPEGTKNRIEFQHEGGPQWALFNDSIESVCLALRQANNQLSEALGYDAEKKEFRNRFAYFFGYQSTVGAVNQVIRFLRKSMPAEVTSKAPGYLSVEAAEKAKALK